jgi:hypothetical protein
MRVFSLLALFISMIMSIPAFAGDLSLSGHTDLAFGRVFQEQGVVYAPYKFAVSVTDIVVTYKKCGADGFFAKASDTRYREEDAILYCNFNIGGRFTFQENLSYDELYGKGEYRQRAVISHPLFWGCMGNAYADVMRGALNTEVYKGEVVCNPQLGHGFQLTSALQLSYDQHFGRTNFGYNVGLLHSTGNFLGHKTQAGFYTKGYEVLDNARRISGINGQIFALTYIIN